MRTCAEDQANSGVSRRFVYPDASGIHPSTRGTDTMTQLASLSSSLNRRAFLAATATAAVASAAIGRDYSRNAAPQRYPDPDIVVLDKRFAKYKIGNSAIQRLHTGTLWAEGPAWNGAGRYLLWSDIPNNVQMRW